MGSSPATATMGQIDTLNGLYRLFGAGDDAKWDAIKSHLDAGRDLLSMSGAVISRVILGAGSIRTTTSATFGAVANMTLPPITYLGRPIQLVGRFGYATHSAASVAVSGRIFDTVSGRNLASTPLNGLTAPASIGQRFTIPDLNAVVPIPVDWEIPVGTLITPRLEIATASGTLTLTGEINNGITGTAPIELLAIQR